MRESLHIESTITDASKTSRYPAMRDDSGARNMSRTQMCNIVAKRKVIDEGHLH